ncbi:MAG: T9SS type A sorting domain-containing protein [Chitinispirillaceae bacterium]|nr:T9SS type A sorting domain-containing protein [Chitinispirillaceae bacterium]
MSTNLLIRVIMLLAFLFTTTLFGKVGIIVNKDLYPSISAAVTRYISDVESIEGKEVWLDKDNFTDANTVSQLKDALKEHFQNDNLEGAVLVGDLPIPIYNLDNDRFACDLYYMDMDGSWSGSGNTFTNHTGDKEGEIWISRITASVLEEYGGFGNEVDIVNKYFDRVSNRMHGQDHQPRTYVIAGMYWEWGTLESENIGDLGYDRNNIETYRSTADNTTQNHACGDRWLDAIKRGMEYGFIYSHSSPTAHSVGVNLRDLGTEAINCRFYNSFACSNADYERANMCGAYALSDNGLVCVGSSKTGSMIPGTYRYYNRPLGEGDNFGEAFLKWFNTRTVLDNKGWHYGMNLQGAGTLQLKPYQGGAYITLTSPAGGEKWEQGTTQEITWGDNIDGNVKIELIKGGSVREQLAASTASDGSFEWQIAGDFETGDDYKIKITSVDSTALNDESDGNFSITPEYIVACPYFQNFDTLENQKTALPMKWEQLEDDLDWIVLSGPTPSRTGSEPDKTGPEGDHTTGNANYLYIEASDPNNPDKEAAFITCKFNFKHIDNPALTFYYHMFSADNAMGDLYLDINVDGTWKNDVLHLTGDHGDEWIKQTVDLNNHKGDRVLFRFRGITGSSWCSDIGIDDFRIFSDATGTGDNGTSLSSCYDLKHSGSRIYYTVPQNAGKNKVTLALYNLQGKLVRMLANKKVNGGDYSVSLPDNARGLYLVRLKTEGYSKTLNMVVAK